MMRLFTCNIVLTLLLSSPLLLTGCLPPAVDPLQDRMTAAQDELMSEAGREAPPANLTLETAVEYALRNNLSLRAAELEFAIEQEAKTAALLRMLPSLQASVGVNERNHHNASSSMGLTTGEQSLIPSFSSERNSRPSDLSMVWSVMDFGLSALRARQAEERIRIAGENLRRLRQQIVMDTTVTYYRLRAADAILAYHAGLQDDIQEQIAYYRDQTAQRNMSENEQARRTMPLLVGLKTLSDLVWERNAASVNLAKAIGAGNAVDVVLPSVDPGWDTPPIADYDREGLFELALTSRPELYRADGETRISIVDAKSALLQLYPNVNFTASMHNDPNRFLVYHNWLEAGVRATWDLLRLPAKIKDAKTAEQRAELTAMRRTITAASIMVQVNLALLELERTRTRVDHLQAIEANRRVLIRGVEEAIASGKAHQADALAERIRHLTEYASLAWAKSDHMAAYARLLSGLGLDPEVACRPDAILAFATHPPVAAETPASGSITQTVENGEPNTTRVKIRVGRAQ
ncbi:MAG: TolC family protein [Planctomycetaceae bacterium]|nr:TolC family protein [Planctomycetaceae bacterium]